MEWTLERLLETPLHRLPLPTPEELAQRMDHTLLRPEATEKDLETFLEDAKRIRPYAVCVHPVWVSLARKRLEGTRIHVATVVAFPHGATFPEVKAEETRRVVEAGAEEVDMVMHVGLARMGAWKRLEEDIRAVVEAAGEAGVKVILETALLTPAQIQESVRAAVRAGAAFVKTSTGFSSRGASLEDVFLMRDAGEGKIRIKASGGIRTAEQAIRFLAAGADRLGLSRSVQILEEYRKFWDIREGTS
jgi:deoxyribose-phosphate aldolase